MIDTAAGAIFFVTTTNFPSASETFAETEEKEYDAIVSFFDTLLKVHLNDNEHRHVVMSTLDDIKTINNS